MRRLLSALAVALVAGACAGDTVGPVDDDFDAALTRMASFAYSAASVGDPADRFMERLAQLPPELALSEEQTARINALIADFMTATAADRDALAAIMEQAKAARQDGATREEVQAILATGADARGRLREAERALRGAIVGVLTSAQRAALAGRTPATGACSTVTDEQRNEISALRAAFEQAYADDIAVVRSARERAVAARNSGATREEIGAIIAEARAAMQRLTAAREELRAAIAAVLTPEQLAARCFR